MSIALIVAALVPVQIDMAPARAWLECARDGAKNCEARSAALPGGALAELARATFPITDKVVDDTPLERVEDVMAIMGQWHADEMTSDVAALFPEVKMDAIQVHIVANGAPMHGDMYVRRFSSTRKGAATLDDKGASRIFINPRLVARNYRGDAAAQADSAWRTLRHEIFHVYFAAYRRQDAHWSSFEPADDGERLAVNMLNEGIGHFLAAGPKWDREGLPADRLAPMLDELATVIADIDAGNIEETRLRAATLGPFWKKYGALSGALMAYGVEKAYGPQGLRDAVREGPAKLVSLYMDAAEANPALPGLPEHVANWSVRYRNLILD